MELNIIRSFAVLSTAPWTSDSAMALRKKSKDNKYVSVPSRILSLEGDALVSAEGDYVLCKVKQKN